MTEAMANIPEGYWQDAKGSLVKLDAIKPEDRIEDELVRRLVEKGERINADLAAYRDHAFDEISAFRELVAAQYDVKKGGAKGNVTLTSFDGTLQVQIAVSETLVFGPQLNAAKDLIDSCITRWSEGANVNLQALIDQAFQVNKGKVDTQRVLGLRRLDMGDDPEWHRAMEAIADAVRVTGSRQYVRLYRVDPVSGNKEPIPLNIANI